MFLLTLGKYAEVELLDPMVVLFFNFLRNLHTVFHSDCTNLYSHQQGIRVPFSSHPHYHLLSLVFLITATLTKVRRYCVGLICISLMINDIEHLFMCLLAICMSSVKKCFPGPLLII